MRIRELAIRNYRAFGDRSFRFSEQFRVIAGINGRGKTALLDGLALLASRLLPHVSPTRSGYRTKGPSDVHLDSDEIEIAMKVNCAGVPIEYSLIYSRESRSVTTTKLPTSVKRAARNAYGDPSRADDAAPMVVYFTTDRAGYRLPKRLPTEIPRGQAAAYTGALFNRILRSTDS